MISMIYRMFVDPQSSSERTLFALKVLNLISNFKKQWPQISIYSIEDNVRQNIN